MLLQDKIINSILSKFPNLKVVLKNQYIEICSKESEVLDIIKELKLNSTFKFDQLIDLTAIDYPSKENRFEIIYLLLSMKINQRLAVKTEVKEDESLDSIVSIHKSANWYERECYDLFGIKFKNHPDLRRILTDYYFEGHPLRKDFPLTGNTEVRYDDLEKKVIYEPVKLIQEYRNFDYMSPWEGLDNKLIGDDKNESNKN